MALTAQEIRALENLRMGPPGLGRAMAALLIDRDGVAARREICAEETGQRRHFRQAVPPQPGRFGYSACGIADLAACDVLCHRPEERRLQELAIAFAPEIAGTAWNDCGPAEVEVALALLAWLSRDEARCARHLLRCHPRGVRDVLLTEVMSLLVRGRGSQIGGVLQRRGPEYRSAMAQDLWRTDPGAFVHFRLLAVLKVGAEQGQVNLRDLSDAVAYLPLWFLAEEQAS